MNGRDAAVELCRHDFSFGTASEFADKSLLDCRIFEMMRKRMCTHMVYLLLQGQSNGDYSLFASVVKYLDSVMTSRIFFIDNICFVCGIVVLMNKMRNTKRAWARLILDALVCFAFWFVCWALLRLVWDSSWVGVIADLFVLVLYALLNRQYTGTVRMICGSVYMSCYILLIGMNYGAGRVMEELGVATVEAQSGGLPVYLMIICVILFLRRWHISNVEQLPGGYMALMLTISILSVLLQLFSFNNKSSFELLQTMMLLVNSCFLLIQLMAYYFYFTIGKQFAAQEEWLALQHKEELEQDILATARQTYESLSELRHEIKNHDAYLSALLEKGDYEGLRAYFAEYQAENNEAVRFVHSGNERVDAIINNRMTRARMLNVRIETMLALPPQLNISEKDLCSLLSNLLDNAVEGCAACGAAADHKVKLHMRKDGGYLFLHTENPVSQEAEVQQRRLSLKTTKDSAALHGYGTKIIRRIAEKYNGAVKFQIKGSQFVVDVMLYLKEGEGCGEE